MQRESGVIPRWADYLAIVAVFGAMLRWTWRTWPDPLVDFGRELYVPWQISNGHALFRDIDYLNGPLSPYFNALWMRLFGTSLNTLLAVNLAILVAVVVLIYVLLDAASDRLSALLGTIVFIAVFAFERLLPNGNYNFVTPYSHEITHGLALLLGAIACLLLPRKVGLLNVITAGLLTGLTLLTKVELALACVLAVLVGFGLRVGIDAWRARFRLGSVLVAATAMPVLTAFLLLWLRLPAPMALKGTFGSLYWALRSNLSSMPFYRELLGTDDLRGNLIQIAIGAGLIGVAIAITFGAGLLAARLSGSKNSRMSVMIAFIATAASGCFLMRGQHWFFSVPKALPLAMAILIVVWAFKFVREPGGTEESRVLVLRIVLALLALSLLAKMLFAARLYHYGFVLAMPATLLLVLTFVSWVPDFAAKHNADVGVVKCVGTVLVGTMVAAYLVAMSPAVASQRFQVAAGADAFVADERGQFVNAALAWIDRIAPKHATLAVVPEGVMINYLSRRANPTPHISMLPGEMTIFGEENVVSDFKAHPPDFVLLVHRDTTEFGYPMFGRDYGRQLANWIRQNYESVVLLGNRPLENPDRFGMLLLKRRAPSTPDSQ